MRKKAKQYGAIIGWVIRIVACIFGHVVIVGKFSYDVDTSESTFWLCATIFLLCIANYMVDIDEEDEEEGDDDGKTDG